MKLRPYQIEVIKQVHDAWKAGAVNVCVQLATGAGKTIIFSEVIRQHTGIAVVIAHRVEIVSQISLTLARYGVRHNILAQKHTIREIVAIHMSELGRSFYDPGARKFVAGVDTLARMNPATEWFKQVGLVVQDEGHHVLLKNKWGQAASLFPAARGLYPTATPVRADGQGLGRNADGIMDALVVGVPMRELILDGYLSDYRIFAPPSDLDIREVPITASGDYSPLRLRTAVRRSHITGDVVDHYLKLAPGKLGVTFAVDIQSATEIATAFQRAGVAAEVISSKTPALLRSHIMQKFRRREILQLVNVDLLGEGVDVPAIEVVSMARPTQSYALYAQQFGRSLRPLEGKTHAIIIDHVNNVLRHGLPDAHRVWSLDRRERRARQTADDVIPLRVCINPECMAVYLRTSRACPYCGLYSPPAARLLPEQVDGDLLELNPDVLAKMRGEVDRVDQGARVPQHLPAIAQAAVVKSHRARQRAQGILRASIAQWAGYLHADGIDDAEIYRRFYFAFKTDVMSAQALNARDADNLDLAIVDSIRKML